MLASACRQFFSGPPVAIKYAACATSFVRFAPPFIMQALYFRYSRSALSPVSKLISAGVSPFALIASIEPSISFACFSRSANSSLVRSRLRLARGFPGSAMFNLHQTTHIFTSTLQA
jgi:hypothetical protein